jgi:cellulose synthase/poly-beta-1,6-N-acetylglucosamine synthase-like glycosyltransferase
VFETQSDGHALSASLLIRTKNEERSLGATLAAVFNQTISPHEVFIIDSGSRDRTLEIAARWPVHIIEMSPVGWSYPRALNVGARAATGEILVCLSAHCPPVHGQWLANLLRHFEDPTVAAAWGPTVRRWSTRTTTDTPVRQEPGSYSYATRQWGMNNANSALRRSLWLEFPFDETLPATEDKAWGMEAMNRGYSLVYDPEAAAWHERHPATHSFRRAKAVMAGYRLLFPEVRQSMPEELRKVGRMIRREFVASVRTRNMRKLVGDSKKLVSVVMAMLGKLMAGRS